MTDIDITADLNAEDQTGYVWTFIDEALDPSIPANSHAVRPATHPCGGGAG